MKKVTKTTKSTKKPALVVDFTDEFNINHPRIAFIEAKIKQNIPFTMNDFDCICDIMKQYVYNKMFAEHNAVVCDNGLLIHCNAFEVITKKKQPWYKRLWNWVTRKK